MVEGQEVTNVRSAKVLGIVTNQDHTWSDFVWGEKWKEGDRFEGLFPCLIKRINMLQAQLSWRSALYDLIFQG